MLAFVLTLITNCQNMCEMAYGEPDHGYQQKADGTPKELSLVLRARLPKVNKNYSQAVESVEHDCGNESHFSQAHNRVLVGADDDVVCLG
jgi:hypothetical protein